MVVCDNVPGYAGPEDLFAQDDYYAASLSRILLHSHNVEGRCQDFIACYLDVVPFRAHLYRGHRRWAGSA